MPIEAAKEILLAANRSDSEYRDAIERFLDATRDACQATTYKALQVLTEGFGVDADARGAHIATVCGAFVENGADPQLISAALLKHYLGLLERAHPFHLACLEKMPSDEEFENGEIDPYECFDSIRLQTASDFPDGASAWEALDGFLPSLLAVLTRSPDACTQARSLLRFAKTIGEFNESAFWMNKIARVLFDEPIVVLEPATLFGLEGKLSGVVDNFQLQVLLMDVFPQRGFLKTRRVPKQAVECAKGYGPQQLDLTIQGYWNMYSWTAIGADGELPSPSDYSSSRHWIWGEGTPEDISMFGDHRVVLLGPPSYERSFGCQRMFDNLQASIIVEQALSKVQVREWLARFAEAVQSQ
jgi:hypothetical protein